MERYRDRREAGLRLAEKLAEAAVLGPEPVVLGIPRGGVVVADVVARELDAQLDVIAVEKVGAPWNPELAIGAVGEGDTAWIDRELAAHVDADELRRTIEREREELAEKLADVRRLHPRVDLAGRVAVVVDDGIATGSTVRVALMALERALPRSRILAVPVAPPQTLQALAGVADGVVCPLQPSHFQAVGQWYERFGQVSRAEVVETFARRHPSEPR